MQGTALLIFSSFVFIMISELNFCICICRVMLYVDGYALETVIISAFLNAEIIKMIKSLNH